MGTRSQGYSKAKPRPGISQIVNHIVGIAEVPATLNNVIKEVTVKHRKQQYNSSPDLMVTKGQNYLNTRDDRYQLGETIEGSLESGGAGVMLRWSVPGDIKRFYSSGSNYKVSKIHI